MIAVGIDTETIIMLVPIFLASVYLWGIVFYKIWYYYANWNIKAIDEYIKTKDISILRSKKRGRGLIKILEDNDREVAVSKEIEEIERGLGAISSIASISPLLGLLGTITGLIRTFMAITERGNIKLSLLSKGIYEALYTTFFGLIVAIISLLFYNYFVSKNKKIVSRIRNAINKEGGISED